MIFFEDTAVEITVTIGVIFDKAVAYCVSYTLRAESSFFAKVMSVVHVLWVVCGGAYNAQFFLASPGNGTAYVHKHSAMISYATVSAGNKEVFLRVNIQQNASSSEFYKLSNHFLPLGFHSLVNRYELETNLVLINYRVVKRLTLCDFSVKIHF